MSAKLRMWAVPAGTKVMKILVYSSDRFAGDIKMKFILRDIEHIVLDQIRMTVVISVRL